VSYYIESGGRRIAATEEACVHAMSDELDFENLTGRAPGRLTEVLGHVVPGVATVHAQAAPYAAAWHEANLKALAGENDAGSSSATRCHKASDRQLRSADGSPNSPTGYPSRSTS
jgi:hypothetical protein